MTKSELISLLKEEGLNIAEDQVAAFVTAFFDKVLPAVAAKTDNTIDDLVLAALGSKAKELLLAQVDKVDGEDDAGR